MDRLLCQHESHHKRGTLQDPNPKTWLSRGFTGATQDTSPSGSRQVLETLRTETVRWGWPAGGFGCLFPAALAPPSFWTKDTSRCPLWHEVSTSLLAPPVLGLSWPFQPFVCSGHRTDFSRGHVGSLQGRTFIFFPSPLMPTGSGELGGHQPYLSLPAP
jgi:hypothetical protein